MLVLDRPDNYDAGQDGPFVKATIRSPEGADSSRGVGGYVALRREMTEGSPAFRLDSRMRRAGGGAASANVAKVRASSPTDRDAALVLRPVDQIAPNGSGRTNQIDLRSAPLASVGWPL